MEIFGLEENMDIILKPAMFHFFIPILLFYLI